MVRVTLGPDELPHAQQVLTGWQTHVSGPDALLVERADPRAVNEALGRSGLWAREIRRERATLESRFLHLTSACRSPKDSDDASAAR
jgi:hypothetical protein